MFCSILSAARHAKFMLPASPDSPAKSSSRRRLAHSTIRDRRLIIRSGEMIRNLASGMSFVTIAGISNSPFATA